MKRAIKLITLLCAFLLTAAFTTESKQPARSGSITNTFPQEAGEQNDGAFLYADFEAAQDKRPISKRGGLVQLISYQESTPSKFKGLANASPAAP